MELAVIDPSTQREITAGYELRLTGWTEARYWAEAPASRYWEFVDGEVIVPSPVDVEHQRVVAFLMPLLRGFCHARGCGEVLMGPTALSLRPGLVREPDIFVLAPGDSVTASGAKIASCPVLVIEVAGSDSERRDLVEKSKEYLDRGVGEYWVVLLARKQVVVHTCTEPARGHLPQIHSAGRIGSSALPGFWVDAEWLWRSAEMSEVECLKTVLGVTAL